jgi:hypothetical protein
MKNTFMSTLFVQGNCTTFGGIYQTKVRNALKIGSAVPEFFCINALDPYKSYVQDKDSRFPSRADINVCSYRNFLFEMDNIDLKDQLRIFKECGIPFTSIVYSGGKSYHAIVSLEKPLNAAVHTLDGIQYYKHVWRRLAAKIDLKASELLDGDKGEKFVDYSCQNPSRLSRFPGFERNGVIQELVYLGDRLTAQAFNLILDSCPSISFNPVKKFEAEVQVEDVEEFWQHCPVFLKNRLRYVDWARPDGMYREIFKLTVQCIDYTKVSKEVLLQVLWERVFPKLISVGYPEHKLCIGVDHGYNKKIRAGEING